MEQITVWVGTVEGGSTVHLDATREVQFTGEELAKLSTPGRSDRGDITDSRGVTETLYRAEDGRLVVHVKDWSQWQGEPTTYSLREVTDADLGANGEFEALGHEAGYGRPLTLDEALGD